MEQVGTGGGAASPCASPAHSPGGAYGPLPYSPAVCQTPTRPQPPQPQQQRQPAQRSAAQRTGWPGHNLTAASAHSNGMALVWKRAVATAAVAPGRAVSASDRRGARAAGRSSWGGVGREIPVTRFKDMEEGGGYPMAREDRERPLSRGKEALRAIGLSRLGGNSTSHNWSGDRAWAALPGDTGPTRAKTNLPTYLQRKRGMTCGTCSQRRGQGLCSGLGTRKKGCPLPSR